VYKDIIEPLESVSVNLVPTDKDDITLFGTPEEVRMPSEMFRHGTVSCQHGESSIGKHISEAILTAEHAV
jgi:hypothetical protein